MILMVNKSDADVAASKLTNLPKHLTDLHL